MISIVKWHVTSVCQGLSSLALWGGKMRDPRNKVVTLHAYKFSLSGAFTLLDSSSGSTKWQVRKRIRIWAWRHRFSRRFGGYVTLLALLCSWSTAYVPREQSAFPSSMREFVTPHVIHLMSISFVNLFFAWSVCTKECKSADKRTIRTFVEVLYISSLWSTYKAQI